MSYKAEFENEEMEIFEAESHEEAIKEACQLSKIHGTLFGLFLIDEKYNEVECIL